MSYIDGEYLAHVGVGHDDNPPGRGSGRYGYGTGETPGQHEPWFKWSRIEDYEERALQIREYKQQGYSDDDIATGLGISKAAVKNYQSVASKAQRSRDMALCRTIYESEKAKNGKDNWTLVAKELSQQLGRNVNESLVRTWIDKDKPDRMKEMNNIVEALEKTVAKKKYVDVGKGTEACLNITSTKLDQALFILKEKGYHVEKLKMEQLGTGHYTNLKILTGPDTTYGDLSRNRDKIKSVTDFKLSDDGKTLFGIEYPAALDSKRVMIRYAEDGGKDRDGTIEIRRGLDDLSLNGANYAQVRINVDNSHYLKGVALYSDDIPKGYDVVFNTNKSKDVPMMSEDKDHSVLKPLKRDKLSGEIDKDNPFGAQIKPSAEISESSTSDDDSIKAGGQYHYQDKNGEWKLSPINKVSEEGDWDKWSRTLPSQLLSKQSTVLVKKQLALALEKKKLEFEELKSLTNPAIKQELMLEFADSCDSDAVELKGHSLPGQRTQLLLPCPSLKPGQIYAPNFRNGEQLALVRFPHAGQMEIPIVTVNNNNKEAKAMIGAHALDAVGVRPETAKQLSGADFDGDTAVCIPINRGNGKYMQGDASGLLSVNAGLDKFDPDIEYPYREGMKVMTERVKQQEIGKTTNLIMDMTLYGADIKDLAPVIKYSMIAIDGVKHRYDYTQAYKDLGIAELNKKYRGRSNAGASTIVTQATAQERVPERKDYYKIDPKTGAKIWEETGATYVDEKTGKTKTREVILKRMETVDDAYKLVSKKAHPTEIAYAEYANAMKAMGNEARLEYLNTKNGEFSKSASIHYKKEVESLEAKLQEAYKNAPRERQAQVFANAIVYEKKKAYNFELEKDELKKIKAQSLANARARFGARKKDSLIDITPEEWKAIEAGALRHTKVQEIIANSDKDKVRDYATPRTDRKVNTAVERRVKALLGGDYSQAEIADDLGISVSTVNAIKEKYNM